MRVHLFEPIPKVPADDLHDLVAILVRPLVSYIISNIALLTVPLTLYVAHRQYHTVHLALTFGIGSY